MIRNYVFILGMGLMFFGAVEISQPAKIFNLWKRWASHHLFFVHGIILVAGGFPLTVYKGPLSSFVFIAGLIAVLSGPFIMIYPEKFTRTFEIASSEMDEDAGLKLIYVDAVIRIVIGTVFVITYFL